MHRPNQIFAGISTGQDERHRTILLYTLPDILLIFTNLFTMRTITTFSLILLWTIHLAAQNFGPVGTKWTYSASDNIPPPAHWQPFYLFANAEEMYNGHLCRKITSSSFCTLPDPCYIYDQNDTVYFYSHITEQFEFLYDFKAQAGDVWEIKGLPGSSNNGMNYTCKIVIDSVVNRNFNGTSLKVWHFTNDPQVFDWGNEIIEGFGACFLMPSLALYEQRICGARCIESPGVFQKYFDYDCDEIIIEVAVNEPGNSSGTPKVFPSPATTTVNLNWAEPASTTVSVFDLTGRLMWQASVSEVTDYQINVADFPEGVYFLKTDQTVSRFVVVAVP